MSTSYTGVCTYQYLYCDISSVCFCKQPILTHFALSSLEATDGRLFRGTVHAAARLCAGKLGTVHFKSIVTEEYMDCITGIPGYNRLYCRFGLHHYTREKQKCVSIICCSVCIISNG